MASLRDVVKQYRDEIIDGIQWVVIFKEGRSWDARYFCVEDGDYDNGYIFDKKDYAEMQRIAQLDHKAICINGYYMGFGEDFTLRNIEDKILYFYDGRMNTLAGDFLDCMVIPPEQE